MNPSNVAEVRQYFIDELAAERFVIDKTGCKMLELVGASFVFDEDAIFGTVNEDYVQREIEWYELQSLNVNDIPGGPPAIWKQVADPDGFINSNYGFMAFSYENYDQYHHVYKELLLNPFSRRAEIIYNRPSMWVDYNKNGRSDFCCTNAQQFLIRDGKLHMIVMMRSCDVVFGAKNDARWARYLQKKLADSLYVECGPIIWQCGSLHVYETHFRLVK